MLFVVAAIMIAAGLAGGTVNTALKEDQFRWKPWLLSVAAGLGASFLTPLFLRTVSSSLLADLFSSSPKHEDLFVFGGFCLLSAITSKAFIQTLSDKIFKEAQEANRKADMTAAKVAEVEQVATDATTVARIAHDAAEYDLRRPPLEAEKNLEATSVPDIAKGSDPDDPWAGQFGGKSEANGRVLEAVLAAMPGRPDWCSVQLIVRSTEPNRPLVGRVQFFLHPTFGNDRPVVPVVNGRAEINLQAWGAFTVGVLADEGKTQLELDLSKCPDATEPWRSR